MTMKWQKKKEVEWIFLVSKILDFWNRDEAINF